MKIIFNLLIIFPFFSYAQNDYEAAMKNGDFKFIKSGLSTYNYANEYYIRFPNDFINYDSTSKDKLELCSPDSSLCIFLFGGDYALKEVPSLVTKFISDTAMTGRAKRQEPHKIKIISTGGTYMVNGIWSNKVEYSYSYKKDNWTVVKYSILNKTYLFDIYFLQPSRNGKLKISDSYGFIEEVMKNFKLQDKSIIHNPEPLRIKQNN